MSESATVVSRQGLHSTLLDRLGGRIVSGAYPPGHVITLDAIDQEYAVSRSVSREAVRVLESMRMVASRRRVGVTVRERSDWNVFDPRIIRWRLEGADRAAQLQSLSELRKGFEPAAAALAAKRATPDHCGTLTGAVIAMSVHGRSGDLEAYLAADELFHRTLLDASGNEMFHALGDVVAEVLAGRTHHHLMPDQPNPAAIRLHADVAEAIQSRDAEGAAAAMNAIIAEAASAVEELVADEPAD